MNSQLILDVFLQHARSEILKYFRRDSCIASTAVVLDVCKHFGVPAEPFPCTVMVFNSAAAECIEKYGWPKSVDTMFRWEKECGAWSVGIGFEDGSNQSPYIGHLVAICDGHHLVDLSLDQATRPMHRILLAPLHAVVRKSFLEGSQPFVHTTENGCVLAYQKIDNDCYRDSPDWTEQKRRQPIVNYLIDKLTKLAFSQQSPT